MGMTNDLLYAVSKIRVVFINEDNTYSVTSYGTGFFIVKVDKEYFITNRHVVDPERIESIKGRNFHLYQIYIDRRVIKERNSPQTEELLVKSFKQTLPDNEFDDIACLSEIEYNTIPTIGYTRIDFELLADKELFDTSFSICDMLAFIGFPEGQYDVKHNLPIVRSGIISSDPRVNYSVGDNDRGNRIAYEVFSTGGSSGSPVFSIQKGFPLGKGLSGPTDFYRPVKLIGINAGHLLDPKTGGHLQLSYFYRSDQIISIIEKAEK